MQPTDKAQGVPVLETKLVNMEIPERQYKSDATSKALAKQSTMTKRNIEAIKQTNRALALDRVDANSLINLNIEIAYSDDTDPRYSAQERTQARKWLQDMAFAGDSGVKGDTGAVTINITGLGDSGVTIEGSSEEVEDA